MVAKPINSRTGAQSCPPKAIKNFLRLGHLARAQNRAFKKIFWRWHHSFGDFIERGCQVIKSRILYKDSQKGISTRTLCRNLFLVSTILITIVLLSSVSQAFSAGSLIKVSQNFFPICPSRASQNFCPSSILPNSVFRPDLQASHENFFPICLNRASQIFGSSSLLLNFAFWSDVKASQKILPPIDLGRASQTFWQGRPLLKFNFRPDLQANPNLFPISLVRASQMLCSRSIFAKFVFWPTLWANQ